MKKLITLFIAGVFGLSLFATSLPTYAKNDNANNGKKNGITTNISTDDTDDDNTSDEGQTKKVTAVRYKNLMAYITGVDTTNQTISIRNKNYKKPILASKAVIIILTADGSKVGTLTDLKVGYKARFWVKKKDKSTSSYEAVVILQDLSSVSKSEPSSSSTPTVKFSSASASGLESVTPVSIPVTLSAAANKDVKVTYSVTGTAVGGGVDFTLANGELTILKGQTTASLSLAVAEDTLDELDETVIVTLSNPENATLGDTKVYTYTIKDNDQPSVSFNVATGSSLENVATVTIPVTLSKASTHEVKVKYALTGTATGGGVDYTLANGELTFAAGATTKDLTLAVVDDTTDESDETVILTLSEPTGATLGTTAVYTHTITDND